ncbi:sulfatase [Chromatiales bacterium (ex Bugula neritina AB1)]|nr:sulfatase [Chromatiales bacterium (ex Bugula neritina AB1)]
MSRKPNILFIITDQQRADWLGCYGHPVLKTPNIDSLAATGTRFDEFHVASPVCMPNRASLMTGRYPSVHGLRYNGCLLPKNSVTFVDVLAEAGYHTAGIGKSHLQPFTGIASEPRVADDELGYYKEARNTDSASYDIEETAHLETGLSHAVPELPYYGFEQLNLLTGHGFKSGGHYTQWLLQQDPDGLELLKPGNQLPHNYSCPQATRLPIPEELYPTTYVKQKALNYLDSRQGRDEPFFAFVSFNDPHHPFNPPGRYWDQYKPAEFTLPPDYEQLVNPIPPMQRAREEYLSGQPPKTMETVFMASPDQIREAMALTAGMISMIDDAVGEIIDKLKATGQYDNTVIIFTSDHGDFLGDHSLMLKGAIPYRGITRVPFIWSDPLNRNAGSCSSLASTVDIAPSLIRRAQSKPYWGIQGRDITPLVMNEPAAGREQLLVEYEDGMVRFGFDQPAMVRSLLSKDHRLTLYKGQPFGELYNLSDDPFESHNRFDDTDYRAVKASLTESLAQQMMHAMETSPRASRRA